MSESFNYKDIYSQEQLEEMRLKERRRGFLAGAVNTVLAISILLTADKMLQGSQDRKYTEPNLPTSNCESMCEVDVLVKPGNTLIVGKGDIILGDVAVGTTGDTLKPLYDNRADTALITFMEVDGKVYAPWGAEVISNISSDRARELLANKAVQLQEYGCINGCQVNVVDWSGTNTPSQNQNS